MRALGRPLGALAVVATTALAPDPAREPAPGFDAVVTVGDVTQVSAILQARLGTTDTPINGDVPGYSGWGYFELSTDSSFATPSRTGWLRAGPDNDYRLKTLIGTLAPGTRYYLRVYAGRDSSRVSPGRWATFRTLPGPQSTTSVEFVMLSCMHYERFMGLWNPEGDGGAWTAPASGDDRIQGYPAFEAVMGLDPDFVISNGDNVYYDHPTTARAVTREELRAKWHRQFAMPRMRRMMDRIPIYFLKDDHDYRFNDADTTDRVRPVPSHRLGIATFREQVPVTDPADPDAPTYRTHRVNRLLQIWFLEGRDFRSPNDQPDGPGKTAWGETQRKWLERSLLESDAVFKVIVSPTPLVGPDDAKKRDNHTNGFLHEGTQFIRWLGEHNLLSPRLFVINGDRHWQYHSIHPAGLEEFGSGAFVSQNARKGRDPGDPESTDPEARIRQPYSQPVPTGGFLHVRVEPAARGTPPSILFTFFDERGRILHATRRYHGNPQ